MPGFTTHYIFGMKAYNDMPFTPLKHTIAKYRWLYQLGLQGPDMFFYNIPILRHRDYRNVGSYMHEHKVNAFFECCLRRIGTIRSRQQQEEAISYLAGFINHYIADSICHPYVYGRIGYPVIVRPAYTLGGSGGGIAADQQAVMGLQCVDHRGGKAGIPCPVQIRLKLSL